MAGSLPDLKLLVSQQLRSEIYGMWGNNNTKYTILKAVNSIKGGSV